jgi:hypothetical protein
MVDMGLLEQGVVRLRLQNKFWNNFETTTLVVILRIGRHLMNGSPEYLGGQLQIGLWLTTWHLALMPQVPGHGSIHFWLTQAWFNEHSELVTHSGLQVGGLPMKPGTQEQTAWPLISLHWLLGPQGEGLHGFFLISAKILIFRIFPSKLNSRSTWYGWAKNKGVSDVAWDTSTSWNMIQDRTFCILTASSRTRILTFISDTGFVSRTVGT